MPAPDGPAQDLGEVRQRSGKRVRAFALEGELDPGAVVSNTCPLEWPPRSGRTIEIPEIDRAEWFDVDTAAQKLVEAQVALLGRLQERVPQG